MPALAPVTRATFFIRCLSGFSTMDDCQAVFGVNAMGIVSDCLLWAATMRRSWAAGQTTDFMAVSLQSVQ
jgi:hypothetical protein